MDIIVIFVSKPIYIVMIRKLLSTLVIAVFLFSCQNRGTGENQDDLGFADTFELEITTELEQEILEDIIENLASPVEVAALINGLGVPFSKEYLSSTDQADDYNTLFQKSIYLGILGTDLGYLNMYDKNNSVIDYISAIKNIADDIMVGQFFDFTTLKRLATNNNNLDSLMYISVRSFNQMDQYLRDNKRSHVSSLVVAGVWLEGLYLATQVSQNNPHPDLNNRIGEQKIVINDLIALLENYKSDRKFEGLLQDIRDLKDAFEDVNITIELGEPEMKEEDGMLVVVQNETSIVEMDETTLETITSKTQEIRNKLIAI